MLTKKKRINDNASIGLRMKQLRSMLGKNVQEFSAELGVTKEILAAIEGGQENEEFIPILAELYKNYGVNSIWLISGEEDIFSCRGEKLPKELFDLSVILSNCNDDKSDNKWIAVCLADTANKDSLRQLYEKLEKTAKSVFLKEEKTAL